MSQGAAQDQAGTATALPGCPGRPSLPNRAPESWLALELQLFHRRPSETTVKPCLHTVSPNLPLLAFLDSPFPLFN